MKRLITFICLIVTVFLGYSLITNGLENDAFNIGSYNTIETKSEALTKKLASYDKKNNEEYSATFNNLESAKKSYNTSKTKYETILEELSDVLNNDTADESVQNIIEETIYSDQEKYKVDFLLVTLGDYGEKEGVDVVYQLTTSSTVDPNSSTLNYFLSDLKFTVTGQYMSVTNFISDLENDDRLGWEIKEFTMGNGSANGFNGVSAQFTVRDVPIDKESYLESASASDGLDGGSMSQDGMADDSAMVTDGGTTTPETAASDPSNTTATTTTDSATTTNTTVSNNSNVQN